MDGWVTAYVYDFRAKNNLSCGNDPNYSLTIKYAITNIYIWAKFWNTNSSSVLNEIKLHYINILLSYDQMKTSEFFSQ